MVRPSRSWALAVGVVLALCWLPARAQEIPNCLAASDIFNLQFAADPQVSPDGMKIVYVRQFSDIMTDKRASNLWIINFDGTDNRPVTTGNFNDASPRGLPTGHGSPSFPTGMASNSFTSAGWTRGKRRS